MRSRLTINRQGSFFMAGPELGTGFLLLPLLLIPLLSTRLILDGVKATSALLNTQFFITVVNVRTLSNAVHVSQLIDCKKMAY